MSNYLQLHGLYPARLLCPWGFSRQECWSVLPCPPPGGLLSPGIEPRSLTLKVDYLTSEAPGKPMNTGVGSLSLLQGIFLTQESNWDLLHCRQILYQLIYQGSPYCYFSSVQSLSRVWLFATPWIAARQASLSISSSLSSLKLRSIESVMPSSHLILCRPFFLLSPTPPSIRVFSNDSTLHMRWPKYWSFLLSIIPSKEHPGLILCVWHCYLCHTKYGQIALF